MRQAIATVTLALALALPALTPVPAGAEDQSRPALTSMSEADRAELRIEIRAYLLEHPEVLFEAIKILEERRATDKLEADATLVAQFNDLIFNDGVSWIGGNPDGDITLVEFSDYRCGYCKRAHPEIRELIAQDPNIRLVVKEFPILGPDSTAAARIALAALSLDRARFGDLNDALMRFEGALNEQAAYRIAAHVGYDLKALKEATADPRIEAQIAENYELARSLGLEGTPSFVLGDQIIRGYLPLHAMQTAVAEARDAVN